MSPDTTPRRLVVQGDALAWLRDNPAPPAASVVTSLPDVSELPLLGVEGWLRFFVEAVRCVLRWLPVDGEAIFYQTDVRHEGRWIDKGHLVMLGVDQEGAALLWHKIVCRQPPGTTTMGRPTYSHMLCVARAPRLILQRGPDVMPEAGTSSWSRGMGEEACRVACRYLTASTPTRIVVDPFCGRGTLLAVANAVGLDAIGVDLSAKRCRAARRAVVS